MKIATIIIAGAGSDHGHCRESHPAKEGPGLDKVEANCGGCHSLDYLVMNSPFPTATLWDAEVTKMIKAFGTPISDADAKEIAEYLTKNYGQP
jgi:mono/diheme cytochrome c family protein